MLKRYIRVSEAAERLGRDRATIRRWYHRGILPGRRLGERIEIDEERIEAIERGEDLDLPTEETSAGAED